MKNIIFLFDLTVYSVQVISLILTFFVFIKTKSKAIRYYLIILSVTLLDNITNSIKDFLGIISVPEKITLIFLNYFSSILLMLWFYFSALLVHEITEKKISLKRNVLIILVSLYPVFYVVSDFVLYGIYKFTPSTDMFSFCEITTQILRVYYVFIFLYTSLILFQYRKNITSLYTKTAARTGFIFSVLFIIAFIADLSSLSKGFYFYFVVILIWNVLNTIYLWKNVILTDEVNTGIENGTHQTPSDPEKISPLGNGILTIKDDDGYIFVKLEDIITVRASNKKTVLKTSDRSFSTDYTLAELDEKSSGRLLRVHRNTVINPDRIKKVEKYFAGTYAVIMDNDEVVEMSRRISSRFRKTFLQ